MVLSLAAPNFFNVTLSLPSTSMNKPALMFRGSTQRGLEFKGNYKRNFAPASPPPLKRDLRPDDINVDPIDHERLLEHGLAFQQNFTVRSFEIGSDYKVSIEALLNYLQDAGVSHLHSAGVTANRLLGASAEMNARDLAWVVCCLDMQVDYYPSWADVVQVVTWVYQSGRNGFCREWRVHDFKTGKPLIQATSLHVMMNKKTRRLSKLREEDIKDFEHLIVQGHPHNQRRGKLAQLDTKIANYVRTSLTPGWMEMDVNDHVSHIKLVNYVLESVPRAVATSHKISAISMDYRRECNRDSVLQSFSRVINNSNNIDELMENGEIEFEHSLRLESGQEVVRGRSKWKPKCEDDSTPASN